VDLGVHLPLLSFAGDELSSERVRGVAETARDCGFAALAANDHLVFARPWLDGLTALASVIDHSGAMTLATTASLAVVRGPVALAKALTAIDPAVRRARRRGDRARLVCARLRGRRAAVRGALGALRRRARGVARAARRAAGPCDAPLSGRTRALADRAPH
jgi:hypothetical protein